MSLLNNIKKKKIVDDMNYDDYDNTPIDSFGINMLKKMGWQENKPINGKSQQKPFELKPRHYRLGLGATPLDPTKAIINFSDAEKIKKGKEKNFFGAKVNIIHGKHKGLKAIIAEKILCEDLNEFLKKNDYVKIELKINKELIKIESQNIKLKSRRNEKVEKSEKKKSHKKKDKKKKSHGKKHRKQLSDYSSSYSDEWSDKELNKSYKKNNNEIDNDKDRDTKEAIVKFLNKKTNRDKADNMSSFNHEIKQDFHKKFVYDDNLNGVRKNNTPLNWVIESLIVRIVNKKNKYYNKKATVVDLPTADKFTLITNDGNMIDNLTESDIETVIPQVGERVIVLKGTDKGELADVIQHDFGSGVVTLQMLNDFSIKCFRSDECSEIENSF